MNECVYSVDEF